MVKTGEEILRQVVRLKIVDDREPARVLVGPEQRLDLLGDPRTTVFGDRVFYLGLPVDVDDRVAVRVIPADWQGCAQGRVR